MRNPQPPRPHPTPLKLRHHRLYGGLRTRNHHPGRPIHRRDINPLTQHGTYLVLRRRDRRHRTTRRQPLHQPATRRHQNRSIRQRPHPRHVRRRQLTNRMTRHKIRTDPPRLQQTEQRHLNREQRRLRIPRLIQHLRFPSDHPAIGSSTCSSKTAHTASNAAANTGNAAYKPDPSPAAAHPDR